MSKTKGHTAVSGKQLELKVKLATEVGGSTIDLISPKMNWDANERIRKKADTS